ncbi:MAG: hypothetical protein IPJ82_05530 [Lewinellaceae bacterium]|nr:hypothetical protein [Lewinellaceae bacterium]
MSYYALKDIIAIEDKALRLRREKLFNAEDSQNLDSDRFGIAFSGGGIRSASVCLGAVRVLSNLGILQKADYLSSVSGGGYTNAYIQAALKTHGDYSKLADEEFTWHMREKGGNYMYHGTASSPFTKLLLIINIITSVLIGLVNPILFWEYFFLLWSLLFSLIEPFLPAKETFANAMMIIFQTGFVIWSLGVVYYYFFGGGMKVFQHINKVVMIVLLLLGATTFLHWSFGWISLPYLTTYSLSERLILICLSVLLGFFTNINSISFGRLYGDSLSRAFLSFERFFYLRELFDVESANKKDFIAPYPLFNCCLNFPKTTEYNPFPGSDFFLLSPKFCGSKMTTYVNTHAFWDYRSLLLTRAMTTSAAAVNTGMGTATTGLTSMIVGLLNFRLGALLSNPLKLKLKKNPLSLLWWPIYYFRSMLASNSLTDNALDISDGGHIENLAVFELLRRKCRLIIGIDAGMDPTYSFEDLKNLTLKARNQLGVEIRFRDGEYPYDTIKPGRNGYSAKRFAIADLYSFWSETHEEDPATGQIRKVITNYEEPLKFGTYVYIKSSVTAPAGRPHLDSRDSLKFLTYKYKLYNLAFPHQTTADQFFRPCAV